MIKNGSLVISLDFELMWGLLGFEKKQGYGCSNVKNVPEVIDCLLDVFHRYDVHATFATVGMIMYNGKSELLHDIPAVHPSYDNSRYSPYENGNIHSITTDEECMFFQPKLVKKLKSADGIEVGTHTFCHFYCWEKGQTVEQFEVDIQKAIEVAIRNGIELKSVVFPRNQVTPECLEVCAKYGITSYRGNALKYFRPSKNKLDRLNIKVSRLLDAYMNVGGMSGVPYSEIDVNATPVNLRASRMLRPYVPKLSVFEGLRLRRIKKEMLHAAKKGEMYHLWFHPHNFGANMEKNLHFLEEVLKYYKELNIKYNFSSYTMEEMVEQLKK